MDHMTPEEFRAHGHALVDWIADYMAGLPDRDVLHQATPGSTRAQLPVDPPETGEGMAAMMADVERIVLPGITHWQHPGWFAFFPSNASGPSILGELLSAGLGVQGMLWDTSPAATELEEHVLDWLVDLLGLPAHWRNDRGPGGGVIQSTASDATHTALVVARHRATEGGADPADLVVYASSQAHSSIEKGARIAGFRHIRLLAIDDAYALQPGALEEAIAADRAAGLVPCAVVSAVGATGTGAVDPVAAIAAIARAEGLWHHVDAAWAGSAMVLPAHRALQAGLEEVDSYVFNPHKWLFVNFDCSCFWVADRAALIDAMSVLPPYLRNAATASGQVTDYRDWHVPLGRRFRSLKVWFVLRHYGRQGLQRHLADHIAWAEWLASEVRAHPPLELVTEPVLSLVCLRHVEGDEATRALVDRVNASGHSTVTGSTLPDGRAFLRVAIGQANTTRAHVERLWGVLARP
jgi:aromatic-L-amino-acid decarboxylase